MQRLLYSPSLRLVSVGSRSGVRCEPGARGGDRSVAGKMTVLFHFSVISYLMNLAGHRGFGDSEDRAWSA